MNCFEPEYTCNFQNVCGRRDILANQRSKYIPLPNQFLTSLKQWSQDLCALGGLCLIRLVRCRYNMCDCTYTAPVLLALYSPARKAKGLFCYKTTVLLVYHLDCKIWSHKIKQILTQESCIMSLRDIYSTTVYSNIYSV